MSRTTSGASLIFGRAWNQGSAIILVIVAGHMLSVSDFGNFALASALTMILSQWVGVGIYETVISNTDVELRQTAFWVNTITSSILCIVGFSIALVLDGSERYHYLAPVVACLSILTFPAGWRSHIESILICEGRLGAVALSNMISDTLALLVGLVGLYLHFGIYSLLMSRFVQFFSTPAALWMFARWVPQLKFDVTDAKRMWKFASTIYADRVLGYFQNYGADLFLGLLFAAEAVAFYRMGARFISIILVLINDPLRTLSWRALSRCPDRDQLISEILKFMRSSFVIFVGPLVLISFLSKDIVNFALGSRWASSSSVISILALSALVAVPGVVTEAALGAVGGTKWLSLIRLSSVTVMISTLALWGHHGILEAAWCQFAGVSAGVMVDICLQAFLIKTPIKRIFQAFTPTLVPVAFMIATLVAIRFVFPDDPRIQFWQTPLEVLSGCIVYFSCVYAVIPGAKKEITAIFSVWNGPGPLPKG